MKNNAPLPQKPSETNQQEVQKVFVPVYFAGCVEVTIPRGLPADLGIQLAQKLSMAKLLATTENPDSGDGELDACMELAEDFELPEEDCERYWDLSQAHGVCGTWTAPAPSLQ